jgi:sulfite exporter TauE/SafE/copper chaperone CopZ
MIYHAGSRTLDNQESLEDNSTSMSLPVNTTTVHIDGMHCVSCDLLVKSKLELLKNIVKVEPDFHRGCAVIYHHGTLSLAEINAVLCEYGYAARTPNDAIISPHTSKNTFQETLLIAGILGVLYYFATQFNLIPSSAYVSHISFTGALVVGLIASFSTCMATTGAILASFLDRSRLDGTQAVHAAICFIVGRLASYTGMGFVLGWAGQLFTVTTHMSSAITVVVAVVLVLLGLDMLRVISLATILSKTPAKRYILAATNDNRRHAGRQALFLGTVSYLLPCGFTLTTQAFAISTGNPLTSAMIMLFFAIGTIPSLFVISLVSQVRKTQLYRYLVQAIGIIVVVVGLNHLVNLANLHGLNPLARKTVASPQTLAPIIRGKQEVVMTADVGGYYPSSFTVRKGVPVVWKIEGKNVVGCQGTIQSPQAGIQLTNLKPGTNTFEFTPQSTGTIAFSCSMGMFTGSFTVVDAMP